MENLIQSNSTELFHTPVSGAAHPIRSFFSAMTTDSMLTRNQRRYFAGVFALAIFILANSAYLFVTTPRNPAENPAERRHEVSTHGMAGAQPITGGEQPHPALDLPYFYQAMLLSHIFGALALFAVTAVFVVWHLRDVLSSRNRRAFRMGAALAAAAVLISATGFFILTESNSGQNRWIYNTHRVLALAIPLLYVFHRTSGSAPLSARRIGNGAAAAVGVWAAMLAVHYASLPAAETASGAGERLAHAADEPADGLPDDPFIPFDPGNLGKKEQPFWPSASTTTGGDPVGNEVFFQNEIESRSDADFETYGFLVNDMPGTLDCSRCHMGVVDQWAQSAHRFSSFNNPFYKASIENLRSEPDGKVRSQWCGSCHDPALLFQGLMKDEIEPRRRAAQAGLVCLACHRIEAIHGKEANGNYTQGLDVPSPYLFSGADGGVRGALHDMLVKSKPNVHRKQMIKPFYRSSEYCMACHKVSLDMPINHYRWLRGQNDYDAWHDSGVALNAARTFYLPPEKRTCRDCHMKPEPVRFPDVSAENGMVRSHRFLAANTALPHIRGDDDMVRRTEAFLRDDTMRVDVFALRRDGIPEPSVFPEGGGLEAAAGGEIQVDVVVRNKGVGHTFPGGTNDSNEGWVEFTVADETGTVLLRSGMVLGNGEVDPEAHFYKVVFVDRNGKPARVRDPQNFHAAVYARVIGPGTADVARYRFAVPPEWNGKTLTARARLMWRKFNRHFTEFVFNREPVPKLDRFEGQTVPDLPITEIAADEKTITVVQNAPGAPAERDAGDWVRYNDYGIAHFLQQDLRTASWAFERVGAVAPERVDGPRNLARVAIMEGRLREAYAQLEDCETLKAGDPQTAWFWGLAKKDEGLYDEAANAFGRVLAYFPEDRAAWRELGRSLYLNGEYRDALEAFLQALAIDPEDRAAHYHRMLCYRALGERELAAEAEKAYVKYQIDESAAQFTQEYRMTNPADNRESQPIHVHDLVPAGAPAAAMGVDIHHDSGDREG